MFKNMVPSFQLVSLSPAESDAKFQAMRELYNKLSEKYDAGGCDDAEVYLMIRIIVLSIIAVQRVMILKARAPAAAPPALQYVEIMDNDGCLRTGRMLPLVRCPN